MSTVPVEQINSSEELRPIIPSDYRSKALRVETARGELGEENSILGSPRKILTPIWCVEGEGLTLVPSKAIAARIHSDGPYYFAENETLAVYGTGLTAVEAVEDLKTHIAHFYKYYRDLPENRAATEALRLKHLFAELFQEAA
jgi:thioredoxin reductase